MRRTAFPAILLTSCLLVAAACPDDSTSPPPTPAIAMSLSSSSITIGQGASATATATITRTNFTDAVALTVEGLPTGVTGTFAPASLPDGTPSSTLTLTASSTATPGSATLTVRAAAAGVTAQTATIALTVNVTGTYALAASPTSVSIEQGKTGSATITLTRNGGFAGTVALAVAGAPNGLTAVLNPTSVTGTSSALSVSAGATTAVGTHTLTITGTTPGLANQTTALSVIVTAPPSTTTMTFNLCIDNPVWVAVQNEGGAWTRVQPSSGTTYTFEATPKFGFAEVTQSQDGTYSLFVLYATVSELAAFNGSACLAERGSRTLSGSVTGLTGSQNAQISMSVMGANVSVANPNWSISNLPDRAVDLAAVRTTNGMTPDRILIRRNISQTSGTLSALDFAGAEAAAPIQNTLTFSSFAVGEDLFAHVDLQTSLETFVSISSATPSTSTTPIFSVASPQRLSSELHRLETSASTATGGRDVIVYFKDGADRTVVFGPPLPTPTITVAASSPYVRMRGQVASQSEYNAEVQFFFMQSSAKRQASVQASSAYFGSLPSMWDLTIPDFSGVAGFDANWGLKPGQTTSWDVYASSGSISSEIAPTDGTTWKNAFRSSTVQTDAAPALRGTGRVTAPRPRPNVSQLFRGHRR